MAKKSGGRLISSQGLSTTTTARTGGPSYQPVAVIIATLAIGITIFILDLVY